MHWILFALYNIVVIPVLFVGFRIAAVFNVKIARGLKGRRHLFSELTQQLQAWPQGKPRIWFHISSMGEFEQAKPVIRAIKARRPDCLVLITFFSPSGYDHSRGFKLADAISYLPFDSYCQARKFLRLLRPDAAVVIRHDIWPNFQWRLHALAVPCFLIDASISQIRQQQLGRLRRLVTDVYRTFTEVHVTTADNVAAVLDFYPFRDRLHIMGDTRYDQVYLRTQEPEKISQLVESKLFARQRCFIAGSTWPEDEQVILPALFQLLHEHPDYQLIIAPHELSQEHLQGLTSRLQENQISFIPLSRFRDRLSDAFQVLVIDQFGILANLYGLGELTYVGGSFGPGVHSVLEPAAHGCMVLFGPRHDRSLEALELKKRGAGQSIERSEDLQPILQRWLEQPQAIRMAGNLALQLVQENLGASERIADRILAPWTGSAN